MCYYFFLHFFLKLHGKLWNCDFEFNEKFGSIKIYILVNACYLWFGHQFSKELNTLWQVNVEKINIEQHFRKKKFKYQMNDK